MTSTRVPGRRARSLLVTFAIAALGLARAASAQTFAAGVGGSLVNDYEHANSFSTFDRFGVNGFLEVRLDKNIALQLRLARIGLPPAEEGMPSLRVDAADLTVAYIFREDWFDAGFFGGFGIYRVSSRGAEEGQPEGPPKEDVFGLTGGVVSVFHVTRRWEVRLEAGVHAIDTATSHLPVFVGGGLAYRF
jgi:hypothetical protein